MTLKSLFFTALALALGFSSASARQDTKFYKKACEKVWGMDLPQFDPKADLSDSIFQGASAVRIAVYNGVTAKYETHESVQKYLSTGYANTSAMDYTKIYRIMIRLNDPKAVEDYTDFDIDVKNEKQAGGYTFAATNQAFGARVYKPDGTVTEVNTDEAFTITEGKKDRDAKRKLAIPGLEPGDVLDYFYYTEAYLDEASLPAVTVGLLGSNPTRSYTFDCEVSPELTLEYASYNGAPLLGMVGEYSKDVNHVGFTITDLPSIDTDMPFFYEGRQMPYLKILLMNNNSPLVYHPRSARRGGVHAPPSSHILIDAGHSLHDTKLPEVPLSKATKLFKDWHKAHPGATEHEQIDACWIALVYTLINDDRSFSDRATSVYFYDMLRKLKLGGHIKYALATSRRMAPINHLVSYREPFYGTLVGDSLYILPTSPTFSPGQISGLIAGEEIAVFRTDRTNPMFNEYIDMIHAPSTRAILNTVNFSTRAAVNHDDPELLDVTSDITFKGASKEALAAIVPTSRMIQAYEDFLGIPEKKRVKSETDPEKLAEVQTKIADAVAQTIIDAKFRAVDSLNISSVGCTPDNPNFEIQFTGTAEGLVSRAGNNLLVNVGKLIGPVTTLTESQRTRDIDAILSYPSNDRFDINITIPEGYVPSPESLQALSVQTSNSAGKFMSQAKINPNDPSTVRVMVLFSLTSPVYHPDKWPEVVALLDANTTFSGTALLFTPAK